MSVVAFVCLMLIGAGCGWSFGVASESDDRWLNCAAVLLIVAAAGVWGVAA